MCSSTKAATTTKTVATPAEAPKVTDPVVQAARTDQRRRTASAQGAASTILTSAQGDTSPVYTERKTLLGQ